MEPTRRLDGVHGLFDDELLTLQDAADELGVHYMTAYRNVRIGRLPAVKRGSKWVVRRADLEEYRNGGVASDPHGEVSRDVDWAERIEARLLAGDANGAWQAVESAMAAGLSPTDVYLRVLSPAMISVGRKWESGEISVADEHVATAVALRVAGRLSPRFSRPGRSRGLVILGATAGDPHSYPLVILSDVLRGEGYEVKDLGPNVPEDAFVRMVEGEHEVGAVGVSVTLTGRDEAVRSLVASLRNVVRPHVPILVGGAAVPDEGAAIDLGADAWARDAAETVSLLRTLT